MKEKKTVKYILWLIMISFVINFIFKPHYWHTFYYSPDKSQVVTAIHYYQLLHASKEKLYFTVGYFHWNKPPESYITLSRTHEYILHWKNNILYIYTFDIITSTDQSINPYQNKDYFNGTIRVVRPTVEEWNRMRDSASEGYIYRYAG